MAADDATLHRMAQKLRRLCLESTAEAGSGHPTSCMSCAEVMSVLFFDEMRFDPRDPSGKDADVFVLSKGHAAPILWAVLKEAGCIDDDLNTLRRYDSRLEGHPTPRVPWVRVATGSLGQGVCAAAGMGWARKLGKSGGRVYTLLGDGEAAEGSVWEAAEFAAFYKLDNLCAIIDVNRLGQSGPTMYQHDLHPYEARLRGFGWEVAAVDGHDVAAVREAFARARAVAGKPFAVLARTLKGKGVSFMEDKEGWHGKPVKKGDELKKAVAELGDTDVTLTVEPRRYPSPTPQPRKEPSLQPDYQVGQEVATREAYGNALARLAKTCPQVVATDGDTKNSTFSEKFKEAAPERFADAYIAEQNMVGVALGMSTEGTIPFASTFACFMTRAYDFIRMASYSQPSHLVLCGSHAGISIGEDGPSQMALEDLAMMRAAGGDRGAHARHRLHPDVAAQDEGALRQRRALPGRRVEDPALRRQGRRHHRGRGGHRDRGAEGARRPGAGRHRGPGHRSLLGEARGRGHAAPRRGGDQGHRERRGPQRFRGPGRGRAVGGGWPRKGGDPRRPGGPALRQGGGADEGAPDRLRRHRHCCQDDGVRLN
jgi:transketolase